MPVCSVLSCKFRSSRKTKSQVRFEAEHGKVSFHLLPQDDGWRKLWLKAINRENWEPHPKTFLCSIHFQEEFIECRPGGRNRLRSNAVPTIFSHLLHHPDKSKSAGKEDNISESISKMFCTNVAGSSNMFLVNSNLTSNQPVLLAGNKSIKMLPELLPIKSQLNSNLEIEEECCNYNGNKLENKVPDIGLGKKCVKIRLDAINSPMKVFIKSKEEMSNNNNSNSPEHNSRKGFDGENCSFILNKNLMSGGSSVSHSVISRKSEEESHVKLKKSGIDLKRKAEAHILTLMSNTNKPSSELLSEKDSSETEAKTLIPILQDNSVRNVVMREKNSSELKKGIKVKELPTLSSIDDCIRSKCSFENEQTELKKKVESNRLTMNSYEKSTVTTVVSEPKSTDSLREGKMEVDILTGNSQENNAIQRKVSNIANNCSTLKVHKPNPVNALNLDNNYKCLQINKQNAVNRLHSCNGSITNATSKKPDNNLTLNLLKEIPTNEPGSKDLLIEEEENLKEKILKSNLDSNLKLKCRKIKCLQQKLKRKDEKIARLQCIIKKLRTKEPDSDDNMNIFSKNSGLNKDILSKKIFSTKKLKIKRRYEKDLKTFALTLNEKSPSAYKYVRQVLNLALPHPKTLFRWYKKTDNCDNQLELIETDSPEVEICTVQNCIDELG